MKRNCRVAIALVFFFSGLTTHAQGNGFNCAPFAPTAAEKHRMDDLNRQIYQIMQHKSSNARNASFGCSTDQGGVITLPVVVHIIDSSGVTIASNANITQMIKSLNDQWRRVTGNGVDMKIQFALAQRDPFGHATNGINRVSGRNTVGYLQYGLNLAINKNEVMDLSYWPSDQYINIYILTKMVGEAGGATSPGSLGKEGIFIVAFNGLFSVGNTTMTHSMGHYLGLYHTHETIFNTTGNDCPDDNNCATQGDLICDTHPHKITDCGSTSCPGSGDLNNSFFNYMSYCGPLTRFTQGQKDRVRLILFSQYRIGLVTTTKALIPVTTSLEASIDSVVYVNDLASPLCGHKLDSVLLRINNLGTSNINLVKIGTSVAGVLTNTVTKSVTITPGTSKLVSVPAITFTAAGSYDLSFELLQINSNRIDYDTLNNKVCTTVEPIILTVNTTTTASPPSGGVFTGGRSFTCNGIDTLRVFKNPGYDLIGIYDEGGNFITSDSLWYYPIDVNEFSTDKQFTAVLQKKSFTITTAVNPANAGTVTPGGTYDYGTSKTLETHKKIGYVFLHWKKNNIFYSSDSIIPITIDDNANYVAVYDIATGIKKSTINEIIKIYPNPASNILQIEIQSNQNTSITLNIIDTKGSLMETKTITNSNDIINTSFNVSKLAKGNYLLNLYDEAGMVSYKFIVE
jgi:hypothetical protein